MPVYEYECDRHGLFEVLRPMAESAQPAPCPDCEVLAARVLSAPQVAVLARPARIAHERNERSRHEPRVASLPERDTKKPPTHGETRPLQRARGSRPWVIEHG